MSRQYDTQLIESVAVRRRRLREAWLFGAARSRHTLDEGVGKLFAGVAVAAVVCAGCVGYSFIQDSKDKNPNGPVAPSPSTSVSTGPSAPVGADPSTTARPTPTRS
ncbi:hypothetical protein Kfla_3240 [Kribbella flavida DSM 17836]|uniref:Uncharacterized protein n=1 Tax=Kribbella flavida (strain DSM 17836 / JCM 10339 / NBRC 14399) TaxID=479435 RepID=D2Q4I8_KRIFD|nr:hypothetical protein [Kribbella flavida]ADB32302.1 hypothetical protein Kfla_3240 [Kribbella flavida DSM 17836]